MTTQDAAFEELLTTTAEIARPQVTVDGEGSPMTPVYAATGGSARVRIAPARSTSEDGLLGRTEDVTHVIWAEPADIRMGDRLVTRPLETELSEEVASGDVVLPVNRTEGLREGQTVEVDAEQATVIAVGSNALTVDPGLADGYEAGTTVRLVVTYEVLGVEDVAGMGHHLRITAEDGG
jgi:hypothetical protein